MKGPCPRIRWTKVPWVQVDPCDPCHHNLSCFDHGAVGRPPYCEYRPCGGEHFCPEADDNVAEGAGTHLDENTGPHWRGADEIPLVVGILGYTAAENMAVENPTSVYVKVEVPAEMKPPSTPSRLTDQGPHANPTHPVFPETMKKLNINITKTKASQSCFHYFSLKQRQRNLSKQNMRKL